MSRESDGINSRLSASSYFIFFRFPASRTILSCLVSSRLRDVTSRSVVRYDHPLDERYDRAVKYRRRNPSQHLSIAWSFSLQPHFALARSLTLPFVPFYVSEHFAPCPILSRLRFYPISRIVFYLATTCAASFFKSSFCFALLPLVRRFLHTSRRTSCISLPSSSLIDSRRNFQGNMGALVFDRLWIC